MINAVRNVDVWEEVKGIQWSAVMYGMTVYMGWAVYFILN